MNNFFLNVVFSVCSGTEVFRRIISFTVFRALRHLVLLAIICSLCFVIAKTPAIKDNINTLAAYLQNQFGNIIIKNNGIYPEKNPDTAKDISFNAVQVNYQPKNSTDIDQISIDDSLNFSGFLWLQDSVIGWMKIDDSNFFVYQALTSLSSHNWFGILSKDDISAYLKNCNINEFKNLRFSFFVPMNMPIFGLLPVAEKNSFIDSAENVYYWSASGIFLRFFITIFFNAIIYSILFAGIYSITNKSNLYNIKFKGFWVTAIYAGFPGIIIGTIFSAANLVWLQYQTVFLIAFIIYLMPVTQKLRKISSESNNKN